MGGGGPDIPDQTTQTMEPPEYLKPYLQSQAATANQLGQIPMEFYPGQTYLPQNEFQDLGASQRLAYATSPAMQAQIASGMGANQFMLGAPDVANNQYMTALKDANRTRAVDTYNMFTRPQIADQFAAAGQSGATRQFNNQELAKGQVMKAIADYDANVDARAYESGLAHQRFGLSTLPATMNLGYIPADAMSAFGAYAAQDPAQQLAENQQRFDFLQMEPWQRLDLMSRVFSQQPGGVTTTSGGGGYDPNYFMQAAGLGLMGYNLLGPSLSMAAPAAGSVALGASAIPAGYSALAAGGALTADAAMAASMAAAMSDRRVKKNIATLHHDGKYQWYAFDYKDPDAHGHGRRIGVMADEVEKINPDAVFTMDDGYKGVHYGRL